MILQGDMWGCAITDLIAPQNKGIPQNNAGFSHLDQDKNEDRSDFLAEFYDGNEKKSYY
jgi:hypothetical protein